MATKTEVDMAWVVISKNYNYDLLFLGGMGNDPKVRHDYYLNLVISEQY